MLDITDNNPHILQRISDTHPQRNSRMRLPEREVEKCSSSQTIRLHGCSYLGLDESN
jgi:hypothetical protein